MIVRRYIRHDSRDILYGPWYSHMPNNGPASCKSLGRTRVETVLQTLFHHRHIYADRNADAISSQTHLCPDAAASGLIWILTYISVGKCAISANVATKYCFSIYVHDKTNGVHWVFITPYYSYKTWLLDSAILSLKLTRVLHNQRFFLPSIFQFFCFHVFTAVSRENFSWETIVEHTYPSDGSINRWN